jgi:hypothetical protein
MDFMKNHNAQQFVLSIAVWMILTIEKLNKGIETEIRLRGEHAQALSRLLDLQRKLDAGGTLTDEEVQLWQKYQEQVQKVAQQIDVVAQVNEKANDELIKTGYISQDVVPKHIDRINEIAEAFDSAWSRNRRYNEEMANINRAFDAKKLTETEKGLESISARLRKLDPVTRSIAESFGATFKNKEYKNLVYALDSVQAFRKRLVKGITVDTVGAGQAAMHALVLNRVSGTTSARVAHLAYQRPDGKAASVELAKGDNLGDKAALGYLRGHVVEAVTAKELRFTNGFSVLLGEATNYGVLADEVQQLIIGKAVLQE